MLEVIGSITTIMAVVGATLNNRHKIGCFYFWMLSNLLSAGIHVHTATYSLVIRDVIFLILAFEGVWKWKKQSN